AGRDCAWHHGAHRLVCRLRRRHRRPRRAVRGCIVMSAADTDISGYDLERSEMIAAYCDRLYGGLTGWVFVGVGHDPYEDSPGKVKFRNWHEQAWRWPAQRVGMLDHIFAESGAFDVYTTWGVSENPVRSLDKRKSRPSRYLCVDVDGASDAQLTQAGELVKAGSFTVWSGRGPDH